MVGHHGHILVEPKKKKKKKGLQPSFFGRIQTIKCQELVSGWQVDRSIAHESRVCDPKHTFLGPTVLAGGSVRGLKIGKL